MADSAEKVELLNRLGNRLYFFHGGLRFACRRCGACCLISGRVALSEDDISALACACEMNQRVFLDMFTCTDEIGLTLKERDDGSCVFYENGCAVYDARPKQCRTWPFWHSNLRREKSWQEAADLCAGIGSGILYSQDEIIDSLSD